MGFSDKIKRHGEKLKEDQKNKETTRAYEMAKLTIEDGVFLTDLDRDLFKWAMLPVCVLTPGNMIIYIERHHAKATESTAIKAMINRMKTVAASEGYDVSTIDRDIKHIEEKCNG